MRLTTSVTKMKRLYLGIPLLLLLAGCASSQDETMAKDRLERARAVYNQASADPAVTGTAQVPLIDAAKDLQAAENTSDYTEMEHRAYLAERKSQTAIALAQGKAADREFEQLQKESNEAILRAKDREMTAKGLELKTAQSAAEKAKAEAESAKAESEKAKSEAERAKSEAVTAKNEADKTKAENEQLVRELSELKGKQTDRGIVLTLGDVLFETGKADLSTQANASIDKLSQFLLNHPTRNLSIEGHTDSVGSDDYNLGLSQRRAEAVKNALVAKGVATERIVTKGLGKKFPIASNATAQGRQLNRRVEVVVLNEAAAKGAAAETPAQAQ
jgi:OmpA-OmpF porin, OOP family